MGQDTNSKMRLLTTATLIRKFHEQYLLDEIYDKAIRSYETLIDVIKYPETAKELSDLLQLPVTTITDDAESIINLLLFNKDNDPYLSFGLVKNAPFLEIHKRWKNIIALYHPDRYSDKHLFEDKAKKINETYKRIQKIQEKISLKNNFQNMSKINLSGTARIFPSHYLRNLAYIIIALAIMLAIFSIFLLFYDLNSTKSDSSSYDLQNKKARIYTYLLS